MFIDPPTSNTPPSLQRSETDVPTRVPLQETLRSAGAPSASVTGVYKHLAPLEPEPMFGRDVSRPAPRKTQIRTLTIPLCCFVSFVNQSKGTHESIRNVSSAFEHRN